MMKNNFYVMLTINTIIFTIILVTFRICHMRGSKIVLSEGVQLNSHVFLAYQERGAVTTKAGHHYPASETPDDGPKLNAA